MATRMLAAGLLTGIALSPLHAQLTPPPANGPPAEEPPEEIDVPPEGEAILVIGTRQRGQVIGDIPPEVQLDPADIQAYGAGTIAELLDAIAPLTQSGRGRGEGQPVILLNGRRISGFSEIRGLPPEAIERVDILPEEVALRYGYRADQRVVNFVLRENFRAITLEADAGFATAGGRTTYEAEANILRIDPAGRWNVEGEYRHQAPLFESERDIVQADPDPLLDLGDYRTLLSESDQYSLGGTLNRNVLGDVSATFNARVEAGSSRAFTGLPPSGAPPALARESDSLNGHLGLAFSGDLDSWRWSLTGNLDRAERDTEIETGAAAPDRARTFTQSANAQLVANGSIFALPAGEVSTSLRLGAEHQGLRGETLRSGIADGRELARGRVNAQANLDLPIASRRRDILAPLGDLSVNFNAELERLSDFGTLRTLGAGLNWSPIEAVRIIASVTDEDGAPSMEQLGDPVFLAPNVRVFDFVRGETVDISRLEGGNPALLADNRRVWKLGATIRPLGETDLTFRADYVATRIDNPIASFPTATPEIEAAFPERFTRDSGGRLVGIDSRPVNFASSSRKELRWGINFSQPLGPERPRGGRGGWRARAEAAGRAPPAQGTSPEGAPPEGAPPEGAAVQAPPRERGAGRGAGRGEAGPGGAGRGEARQGGGGRGRGGFGRGGGGGRASRLQLGLFHTWRFEDEILIREGVPMLDLLGGSAVGGRGGQPRHQLEFQAGLFKNGFGARFTAEWQEGTIVRGGPAPGGGTAGDLFFGDFMTANLRLFANLGQQRALVRRHRWLRGTRVTLSITNVFDSRLDVRDSSGQTPLGYQRDLLDPLGRSIRLGIRKQF